MSQQDKYAQLFAAEAREHLAEMSRALVALEGSPDDRESLNAVNAVFRSVHTIKGMAGAMGYDVASRLAHNIESVLDELRTGRRQVSSDLIDILLKSTDLLDTAVEATVEGREPPDPTAAIERLVLWRLAGDGAAAAEQDQASAPAAAVADSGVAGALHAAERSSRRADSSRVRVDIRRLDVLLNLMGELTIVRGRLQAMAEELDSEPMQELVEEAGRLVTEMQMQVVESRMVPMWQVFDRFPRLVRDAARTAGKVVEIEILGKELELDRSLIDAISDPLVHLLRNAVDHGIESPEERERAGKPRSGRIELSARRERSRVVIVVRDDGRGIDRERIEAEARRRGMLAGDVAPSDYELFNIMARPGFSTAEEVTSLSGRGVGLNVVDDTIRSLGGSVELRTEKGVGTTIRLELPLTLVIMPALIVAVAGQPYALPATFIRESFEYVEEEVEQAHGREWVRWREERIPLTRLQSLFGDGDGKAVSNGSGNGVLNLVALEFGGERLAVSVDEFVGEEEVVVKSFDMPRGAVPVFSGATVRPDGRPALVLDVGNLS
ncbi:MAG: chemotaxis protein CheA [Gemmatimonadota bacterium]